MISIKQLHYALAVAKHLHFKKAAEQCHVSQSALSTALSELEKHLGINIFERDNKKVLITPEGQEVLNRAHNIVSQVQDLEHLAESQLAPLTYPVSIGMIPTIAPYLLPVLLPNLNKQFPNAELNVIEEQSHVLLEKVRLGELDSAIIALPYHCEGLLCLEFWQEDFYWVSKVGGKYSQREEINREQLLDSRLLLLQDGHCLKEHIMDVCKLVEPGKKRHSISATSLTTIIHMVEGNLGTTLIPAMAIDQLIKNNSQLTAVHLNEPSPHRSIAFVIRPNFTRTASIEALMALCKQALADQH